MNKVIPIAGLIILLLAVGIWISRPQQTSPVLAQETTENSETTEVGNTSDSEESTSEDATSTETNNDANASTSESTEDESTEANMSDDTEAESYALPEGFAITSLISEEQLQVFEESESVLEENKDYQVVIETNKGVIRADLFEDGAPNTVNNFVFLAKHKYFDGIIFHRVLEDFMAQTGDPTGSGRGGPGYTFEDEFNAELRHTEGGTLSMANSGPNTNGSQFFITFAETPWLDDRHSVFGKVIEGDDVLANLERIDPSNPNPSSIFQFDESSTKLADFNLDLETSEELSIEAYLTELLGELPDIGERFSLGELDAITGRIGDNPALGIFAKPDVMTSVYIIEADKE